MELRNYAALAWRWLWLIVLGAVLAGATVYLVARGQEPVYQASTKLLVNQSRQPTTTYDSIIASQSLVSTYAEWLRSPTVLEGVAERLGSPVDAAAIKVTALRDTLLLVVTVEDTDPVRAAAIANTIPEVFGKQNQALQTRRFTDAKAAFEGRLQATQAEMDKRQIAITQLKNAESGDAAELTRLESELQQQQTNYTSLLTSLGDLLVEEARGSDIVEPIQRAEMPTTPIRPTPMRNAMLAAVVGALLAAGVAFLIEYLNDVIKNPEHVESVLGLTTLGVIPRSDTPGAEELTPLDGSQVMVAEAYRVLRTNLQFASVDRPLRMLLITSPAPEEGKSRTAVNLAVALAQAGQRVVLIDGDLHRPRIHHALKLPNNVGLTTALLAKAPRPGDLLQKVNIEGLQVLTSGPLPPNAAELLGSARMSALLEALTAVSDIIIIDSPPITALADAAILAAQVDGVLLVLDASKTRSEVALRALHGLERVQARVLGAALNRVPARGAGYPYYYYSYSQYNRPNAGGDGSGDDSGTSAPAGNRRSRRAAKSEAARAAKLGET